MAIHCFIIFTFISDEFDTNIRIYLEIQNLLHCSYFLDDNLFRIKTFHLQTPYLSKKQRKSEGDGRIDHVIEKSIEIVQNRTDL